MTRNFPWLDPLLFSEFHMDVNGMPINRPTTVVHEMGHVFGLIHTHASDGIYFSGNQDPYDTIANSTGVRELVIRDTNFTKLYPYPNCEFAGDLVCDTPAECAPSAFSSGFNFPDPNDPDCQVFPFIGCASGCNYNNSTCQYTGSYVDYNDDSISPAPVGNVGENFMSYWLGCRNTFTDGQFDRALYYYDAYFVPRIDNSLCGNLEDFVEFEDTNVGLEKVVIDYKFPNDTIICNAITDSLGKFQAILYDSLLSNEVYPLGTGEITSSSIEYSEEDWRKGVTTFDIIIGTRHILGVETLNGYKQLAGDVNNSGIFTTFDLVLMRKLILAVADTFPNQTSPWRYIPEYIPQDHSTAFNNDPFNMTISGQSYTNSAPYIESDWEYVINNGLSGKNGFDAIKLGDLDGSFLNDDCLEPSVELTVPNNSISTDKDFDVEVKINSFNNIAGFQLGFFISKSDIEFIDAIPNGSLPGFSKNNFGLTELGNNEFRVSWVDSTATGQSLSSSSTLLTFQLKSKTAISDLSNSFQLDSTILKARFYKTAGCSNGGISLGAQLDTIVFRSYSYEENNDDDDSHYELGKLYCYPNPAKDIIHVSFESDEASEGEIFIRDLFGRFIKSQSHSFKKGANLISLQDYSFPSGVLFITVSTSEGKFSTKVVVNN